MRTRVRELHLKTDIQIELFDKLVAPVLLYGCEVLGFGDLKPIEIFYRKFLKRQLAVTDKHADVMVYGETGTHRLQDTVSQRMVGYTGADSSQVIKINSVIMYKLLRCLHFDPWSHLATVRLDQNPRGNLSQQWAEPLMAT